MGWEFFTACTYSNQTVGPSFCIPWSSPLWIGNASGFVNHNVIRSLKVRAAEISKQGPAILLRVHDMAQIVYDQAVNAAEGPTYFGPVILLRHTRIMSRKFQRSA